MDSEMAKVEALFAEVEQRLSDASRLPVTERRKEARLLDPTVLRLTREFERFQMIGFNKFPTELEQMEERLTRVRETSLHLAGEDDGLGTLRDEQKADDSDVLADEPDPTAQMVIQTNNKLTEGKKHAMNLFKAANTMRDELCKIEDEVLLQRERLMEVNAKIQKAHSVSNQTKKLISYFTKTIQDDKIIRGLIVVVALMLLAVLGMALSIRNRQVKQVEAEVAKEAKAQEAADYSRIDEQYFYRMASSYHLRRAAKAAAAAEENANYSDEENDQNPDVETSETNPDEDSESPDDSESEESANPSTNGRPSDTPEPPKDTTPLRSLAWDVQPLHRRLGKVL